MRNFLPVRRSTRWVTVSVLVIDEDYTGKTGLAKRALVTPSRRGFSAAMIDSAPLFWRSLFPPAAQSPSPVAIGDLDFLLLEGARHVGGELAEQRLDLGVIELARGERHRLAGENRHRLAIGVQGR